MKYTFSKFILDTQRREVTAGKNILKLSSLGYEVLLLFVENPDKIFSKEVLIEQVWQGRYVTNNSVDQCISKLRKALDDEQADRYIETIYSRGLKFVPKVATIKEPPESLSKHAASITKNIATQIDKPTHSRRPAPKMIITLLMIAVLSIVGRLIWIQNHQLIENQQPQLLLLNDSITTDTWSIAPYLERIFSYANAAQIKSPEDQLDNQAYQPYLEKQWRLSPDLKIVTSRLETIEEGYSVTLTINSNTQPDLSHTFKGKTISPLMKEASLWLANQINQTPHIDKIQSLIPTNSFLLELYMRGVAAAKKGDIDKAEYFFKLCLKDNPNFHLARLALAEVKSNQGKLQESVALLDTLSSLAVFPQIEIEIEIIRGHILHVQGKYAESRNLYLHMIKKYKNKPHPGLDTIHYNLSRIYMVMQAYDDALAELKNLETGLSITRNPELLASVYQKTASIQQNLGRIKLAEENANKALNLFSQLEDLPGKAKTLSLLARITNHQSLYDKSVHYLQQSLRISQSLNYKLGIGATLNELIYVFVVQGKFTQATALNNKMQDIALEIDYANMLLAAKQHAVDIARAQKKWITARLFLDEHLELALATKNERAILKNKLLSLDFYLDQNKHAPVLPIIKLVQQHIEQSKEIRLEPRLKTQLARYYILISKESTALDLLQTASEMAIETDDRETLSEIGNILAQYHLNKQQPNKALSILQAAEQYNPLPYPYLLLKSKALMSSGQVMQALEYANLCKQNANEWWSREDKKYLVDLQYQLENR